MITVFGRRSSINVQKVLWALAVATIAVTASLFGLQYRLYYAEWHAEPL